jgi:hypothetical protein
MFLHCTNDYCSQSRQECPMSSLRCVARKTPATSLPQNGHIHYGCGVLQPCAGCRCVELDECGQRSGRRCGAHTCLSTVLSLATASSTPKTPVIRLQALTEFLMITFTLLIAEFFYNTLKMGHSSPVSSTV